MPRRLLAVGVLAAGIAGVLPLSAATPARAEEPVRAQVIGGGTVATGSYPFVVAIQGRLDEGGSWDRTAGYSTFCSGSLIAPQWILTAGHCAKLTGMAARPGGLVQVKFANAAPAEQPPARAVDRAVVHPGYFVSWAGADGSYVFGSPEVSSLDTGTDATLLHLTEAAPVAPVRLASSRRADQAGRDQARIAGYGIHDEQTGAMDDVLRAAEEPLASDSECARQRVSYLEGRYVNPRTQLCRRKTRSLPGQQGITCNGDSGGPIMLRRSFGWLLVGLTSWGGTAEGGCWGREAVDIYTRVATISSWVRAVVDQEPAASPKQNAAPSLPQVALLRAQPLTGGRLQLTFRVHLVQRAAAGLRLLFTRYTHRNFSGEEWRPLIGLGEPLAFTALPTQAATGRVATIKVLWDEWQPGQCLTGAWQAIDTQDRYSALYQRSWKVTRDRAGAISLARAACGFHLD